jgi:hypothetical protein
VAYEWSSMTAAVHHWLEGAPTARIEDLESRPHCGAEAPNSADKPTGVTRDEDIDGTCPACGGALAMQKHRPLAKDRESALLILKIT